MATSNEDIMRELGQLGAEVRHLREEVKDVRVDLKEERAVASENRSKMHARLDRHVREVGEIEGKVITIGITLEQQRGAIEKLAEKVDTNQATVQPSLDDWKKIKTLGWGFSGLLVAIGVTGGSALIYMGDAAVTIMRKWLRID